MLCILVVFFGFLTIVSISFEKNSQKKCVAWAHDDSLDAISYYFIASGNASDSAMGAAFLASENCIRWVSNKKEKKKKLFKPQKITQCDPWAEPPFCHRN